VHKPMALCYFSYHLIIIAVCTIASFRPEDCEGSEFIFEEGSEERITCRFVFSSFACYSVVRGPRARSLIECFLICEVNWHVPIRHHVIKSNLRHPHCFAPPCAPMGWERTLFSSLWVKREGEGGKNASLKCLISYNYLIIPREGFPDESFMQ
jgi:hypothetical protein